MKNSILIFLVAATCTLAANTFYPVPIRDGLKQYVAFGKELYVFQLPSMKLNHRETYSKIISNAPTSISGSTLYFTKTSGGDFEINTSTFSLTESGRTVPNGQPSTGRLTFADSKQCDASAGTSYCFVGGTPATVTKTVNGHLTSTLSLGRNLGFSRFVVIDTAAGILHVTGYTAEGRGSDSFTYFQIALSTFTIAHGPVSLEHTANSGCPVEPRSCGVDVLLYMDANNGVLSYVSSFAISSTTGGDSTYQITVTSRSFPCGNSSAVFDDVNKKAPTIHSGSCGSASTTTRSSTSTTSTSPTGTSTCPSNCGTNPCCNDIRLGNICYSATTHHCVNNVPSGSKVLCAVTDQACGGYCYDTTMYGCRTNGTLYHL